MSAWGQTATWWQVCATSVLPQIADIRQRVRDVAHVPGGDIRPWLDGMMPARPPANMLFAEQPSGEFLVMKRRELS
jgi:hypothetical protein